MLVKREVISLLAPKLIFKALSSHLRVNNIQLLLGQQTLPIIAGMNICAPIEQDKLILFTFDPLLTKVNWRQSFSVYFLSTSH